MLVSGTTSHATHRVAKDEYVSNASAWRRLPRMERRALVLALAAEEKRFRSSLTRGKLIASRLSATQATIAVAPSTTVGASGAVSDPEYTFGYEGMEGFTGTATASHGFDTLTSQFVPCSSNGSVTLCGGLFASTQLYSAGSARNGLAATAVAAEGWAAGASGEDLKATVPASDLPTGTDEVTLTLHVFTLNASSCVLCVASAGAAPSEVFADGPFPSMAGNARQYQVPGPLESLSVNLPGLNSLSTALGVAQAGYSVLQTITAPGNFASSPCGILTGEQFAQALGAVSGVIPSAGCKEETLTWTGRAAGGQPLSFDVEPTAFAVNYGAGIELSALFGVASATVSVTPVAPTPASGPQPVDLGNSLNGVSCVPGEWCAAIDDAGNVLFYSNGAWGAPVNIDGTTGLASISCVSSTFCVSSDSQGHVLTYDGSTWTPVAVGTGLGSISCVSQTFCGAIGGNDFYTYNGTNWSDRGQVSYYSGTHVACVASSMCVIVSSTYIGVDLYYQIWNGTSLEAAQAAQENGNDIGAEPTSLTCMSATSCLAGLGFGGTGDIATDTGGTWSVASVDGANTVQSISCSGSFCVAVDSGGNALVNNGGGWVPTLIDSAGGLSSVSCAGSGFCAAVDGNGDAFVYSGGSWK